MKQYKGHTIIKQSEARLVPPNHNYPDCRCFLAVSERCFFVLEDNYNNTYTEHFFIPLDKIQDMNVLVNGIPDNDIHVSESTGTGAAVAVATAFAGLLAGLIILPGVCRKQSKQTYLRVDYLDEWLKPQEVYFIEIDSDTKKIVKYWNSLQIGTRNQSYRSGS